MASKLEDGLRIRREVLGDDYVDASMASSDEFGAALQELISESCWGGVWAREGLDRRTRSLLNLAMLSALNRPNELLLHTRAALTNGVTPDEIREVVLQVAVYCGAPAALDAQRVVRQGIAEYGGPAWSPAGP